LASAAATVAISAPSIEKTTVITPTSTELGPNGAKPPCCVRFASARSVEPAFGVSPIRKPMPSSRKTTIAPTLIDENRNSNSAKARVDHRFVATIEPMMTSPLIHTGTGAIGCSSLAAMIASTAMVTIQPSQ
jgi:hypothetical protein